MNRSGLIVVLMLAGCGGDGGGDTQVDTVHAPPPASNCPAGPFIINCHDEVAGLSFWVEMGDPNAEDIIRQLSTKATTCDLDVDIDCGNQDNDSDDDTTALPADDAIIEGN